MRILLVAMPDTASSLDRVMKFPNLGLCSIAAQVPEHDVRILDLVMRPRGVRRRVLEEVAAFAPDRPFDVAETSRGCPLPCAFCSIRRMYGRTFRRFPIGRVIADLRALDRRGVRGVFFVDDNITIDVPRFKELCEEIQSAGLGHLRYIVQASVHGIAKDPTLAPAMARAGFDTVFMGIENAED